jgi:myo-inositol-hexaphosphate 3-phosphohydrolase
MPLFTVNDYEARIYSYEADIPGIFSSAMYYRNGMRAYLLIKYQVSDKLAVFFKTGRTEYFSAPEIPENSNQTKNWKNELKFLINCSF